MDETLEEHYATCSLFALHGLRHALIVAIDDALVRAAGEQHLNDPRVAALYEQLQEALNVLKPERR